MVASARITARVRSTSLHSRVVVTLTAVSLLLAGCSTRSSSVDPPHVVEVIDGDTIVVAFGNGVNEPVRLLGVDTPETVDPSRPVQCFGAEASAFVRSVLPDGTVVRLERDVEARDHFGRLLAYVYRDHDGLFVNGELLRLGYADIAIYPPNESYEEMLNQLVVRARTQNTGLWASCGGADVAIDPAPIGTAESS